MFRRSQRFSRLVRLCLSLAVINLVVAGSSVWAQIVPLKQLGVGSCAAAGCHGGDGTRKRADGTLDFSSSSYSTWMQRDPHARAYEVLLNSQSREMIRKLGTDWPPAHQNRRCLVCHSSLEPSASAKGDQSRDTDGFRAAARDLLQDGVSCEACHGPAEKWLVPHTDNNWRNKLARDDFAALGFVDLRFNLSERSRTCARCHVGGPGRDVDHDLIAAGHPRLNFEMAAYHANLPAHWNQADDRHGIPVQDRPDGSALEAKLWLTGQLASAEAALHLLETRTRTVRSDDEEGIERQAAWPEFAEYGCFACHHDLQAPSWRQEKNSRPALRPGSYPWGTWTFPLLTVLDRSDTAAPLSEAVRQLEETMSQPTPALQDTLSRSRTLRGLLSTELGHHVSPGSLSSIRIRELLNRMTQEGPAIAGRGWDGAAQVYLGTVSLYQGRLQSEGQGVRLQSPTEMDQRILISLEKLRDNLKFPAPTPGQPRFSSPKNYDATRIELIDRHLKAIEEIVKGF